ncbi:MAG: NADPH-dependent FMN reductase [Eubacteriales bacterium]|nr:NADPH-dependent FMN reductase [Eubacteriales bacterium]
MKQILFMIGSLRKGSFNRQVAKKVEELLEGKARVAYLEYADIPYMNQDLENPDPAEITRVKQEVSEADGIWIFTPEYNRSYSGVLKNLLDWLSRPLVDGDLSKGTAISGKKVMITGVGGRNKTQGSRDKLYDLLKVMKVEALDEGFGIMINPEAYKSGVLTISDEVVEGLEQQVKAFLEFLEA